MYIRAWRRQGNQGYCWYPPLPPCSRPPPPWMAGTAFEVGCGVVTPAVPTPPPASHVALVARVSGGGNRQARWGLPVWVFLGKFVFWCSKAPQLICRVNGPAVSPACPGGTIPSWVLWGRAEGGGGGVGPAGGIPECCPQSPSPAPSVYAEGKKAGVPARGWGEGESGLCASQGCHLLIGSWAPGNRGLGCTEGSKFT